MDLKPLTDPDKEFLSDLFQTELLEMNTAPTTPAPNRLVYAVGVKLMNLAESFEAPEPGSVEFKNLAATISDSFNGVLNNIPGYYKTDILGFEK